MQAVEGRRGGEDDDGWEVGRQGAVVTVCEGDAFERRGPNGKNSALLSNP